jgi:hypothetical protein
MCSSLLETGGNSGAGVGADATGASLARQGATVPDCTMSFGLSLRLDDSWANAGREHIARITHFNRVFISILSTTPTSCHDALRPNHLSVCYRTLIDHCSPRFRDACDDRGGIQHERVEGAAQNVLHRTETKAWKAHPAQRCASLRSTFVHTLKGLSTWQAPSQLKPA